MWERLQGKEESKEESNAKKLRERELTYRVLERYASRCIRSVGTFYFLPLVM